MPEPQRSSRRREAGRLARWVLVMGALASAALGVVAFAVVREPGAGARADFLALSAELGAAVQGEWGRFRVGLGHDPLPLGDLKPARQPVEIDPGDVLDATAFDALLGEARRAEFEEAQPQRALELLREALDRNPEVELGRRAEALLRALGLARQLGDANVAHELWSRAERVLVGHETRRGWSYLFLAGLAAAQVVPEAQAAQIVDLLLERWTAGDLVLPQATPQLGVASALHDEVASVALADARWTWPASGTYGAALRRFEELVTSVAGERAALRGSAWERACESARARELVALWGDTPAVLAPGLLELQRRGPLLLAVSSGSDGTSPRAALYDAAAVSRAFAQAATSAVALPDGFLVETTPSTERVGAVVRGRAELEAGVGFSLRHRDPEGAMQASSRRLQWLRVGLVLGAVLCLAAAWITARALRREARLSALRRAFVASVSHELRTPVASILLLADNLTDGAVQSPEAVSRYHALIGREARRLSRLVNDVLDMSRLDRGEPARVRLAEMELSDFVASLEDDLAELSARHEVPLQVLSAPTGRAALDTEGLRRAILNLVENAMIHGGAPVHLSYTGSEHEWGVEVRDHGAGVPAAQRARLFEAFEHGGAGAGTGLGLAIVAALAEAHGGRAAFREPGDNRGAIFSLQLPRSGVAAAAYGESSS